MWRPCRRLGGPRFSVSRGEGQDGFDAVGIVARRGMPAIRQGVYGVRKAEGPRVWFVVPVAGLAVDA